MYLNQKDKIYFSHVEILQQFYSDTEYAGDYQI